LAPVTTRLRSVAPQEVESPPSSPEPADPVDPADLIPTKEPSAVRPDVQLNPGSLFNSKALEQAYSSPEWAAELKKYKSEYVQKPNRMWYRHGKLVLPSHTIFEWLRHQIIREHHGTPVSGHFGVAKVQESLQRYFFWRGMHKEIVNFIQTCVECQRNKYSRSRPFGLLQPLPPPVRPWQELTMDFVTSLPITVEGFDTVVTFVDRFTKLVHFRACTTTGLNAVKLADIFLEEIFRHHGVPQKIISDRDPKMNNRWWKEVLQRLGTRCRFSTAFHPETDGQLEIFNKSLQEVLRNFISPDMTNWARLLPLVEFACNSHKHEGTKHSPFYLTYGRHPVRPIDLTFETEATNAEAQEAAEELHKAIKVTQQFLLDHNSRMKQQADKKRKEHTFQEGDMVWLSSKNFSWKYGTRKLLPKYMGPFKLLRSIGPNAFALELPEEWKIHNVFHVSLLKPVVPGTQYWSPNPVKVVDGIPEWEVRQILRHRGPPGRMEYLVAWVGYGPEYHSWLNADKLENSPSLLSAYHERMSINPSQGEVMEVD
jgi:hypothetical protein